MDATVSGTIAKKDDDQRLVFGWANVAKTADGATVIDRQDDFWDTVDDLEETAYDYVLHSRDGGDTHLRKGVATLVESFVSTPDKLAALGMPADSLPQGWWVGFKVHDDGVWKGVKEGRYTGFSIGGSGQREKDQNPVGKVAKGLAAERAAILERALAKRDVSSEEREKLAGRGAALPDGSFPIANEGDLRNAIQAFGRAKDKAAAKAHIIRRAKALGCPELIPESWVSKGDPLLAAIHAASVVKHLPGRHNQLTHGVDRMIADWEYVRTTSKDPARVAHAEGQLKRLADTKAAMESSYRRDLNTPPPPDPVKNTPVIYQPTTPEQDADIAARRKMRDRAEAGSPDQDLINESRLAEREQSVRGGRVAPQDLSDAELSDEIDRLDQSIRVANARIREPGRSQRSGYKALWGEWDQATTRLEALLAEHGRRVSKGDPLLDALRVAKHLPGLHDQKDHAGLPGGGVPKLNWGSGKKPSSSSSSSSKPTPTTTPTSGGGSGASKEGLKRAAEVFTRINTGSGSPTGTGTVEDPIDVKGDLDKAVELIAEGKHVRLNQPDEVVTVIDKLAKVAKDMQGKGEKAPNFNLCLVTMPGTNLFCHDNKGIPRIKMPQLKGQADEGTLAAAKRKDPANPDEDVSVEGEFVSTLKAMGIKMTDKDVPASHLRATQSELVGVNVAGIMGVMEEGAKPGADPKLAAKAKAMEEERIFVTRDGYVIDGHHRWAAKVGLTLKQNDLEAVKMPVTEIDLDIGAALDFANGFVHAMGIKAQGATSKKEATKKSDQMLDRLAKWAAQFGSERAAR